MNEPKLAKLLRVLVYVAAFIPLVIFSQFISPFHFGKVVVFRSLVELMLVLYLGLIWAYPAYRPKFNIISWSFLGFAMAFSLATATSILKYPSFWGSLERMGGLWTFWHYFIFFVILVSVFRKKEDWRRLFDVMIFVGVLSALYGFGQKTDVKFFVGSGGRERIFGTLGNAALFAGYQILVLFLALTSYFKPGNSSGRKQLLAGAAILNTVAILMTAVRGSLLALAVGYFIFFLLRFYTTRAREVKKIVIGLLLAGILFGVFAVTFNDSSFVQNSRYLRRVTDFSFSTRTVMTRFWAWEAGLKGWSESPKTILLGWGPENFNLPFSKNFNPKFFTGPGAETLFDRAHNMFVEVLVTMGLVGLLSYVFMLAAAIWVLWKFLKQKGENTIYAMGFIPLIIAYMIHNSFIFDTSANFLTFFMILGFISFIHAPQPLPERQAQPRMNTLRNSLVIIGLIGAVVLIYKTNVIPSNANYAITRAIIKGWQNDPQGAVDKYREALAYNTPGKYEYRHRYAQYVLELSISKKMNTDLEKVLLHAVDEVNKNVSENKVDYLPYLYLSRLYINLGKESSESPYNDEALKNSMKALELSPTFVRTYFEVAQAYLNKKDPGMAIEYFKKAAELSPDATVSYWYWGIVEIERGNVIEGLKIVEEALQKGYQPPETDLLRLIGIYVKLNDFNKVVPLYERVVDISPTNAQHRASLAVAYARVGKIDQAIASARKAAEIDPTFIPEAKAYVESLGGKW